MARGSETAQTVTSPCLVVTWEGSAAGLCPPELEVAAQAPDELERPSRPPVAEVEAGNGLTSPMSLPLAEVEVEVGVGHWCSAVDGGYVGTAHRSHGPSTSAALPFARMSPVTTSPARGDAS